MADSESMRALLALLALQKQASKKNPSAAANRGKTREEKERLQRELDVLNAQIRASAAPLEAFGLVRLKQGKQGRVVKYVTTGIGPDVVAQLQTYFASSAGIETLKRLRQLGIAPKGGAGSSDVGLSGLTFVLTGTFETMSRTEATDHILSLGGSVTSSVSSNTDYVVAGESPGATKTGAAEKLGVPVVDEAALLRLLGAPPSSAPRPWTQQADLFE